MALNYTTSACFGFETRKHNNSQQASSVAAVPNGIRIGIDHRYKQRNFCISPLRCIVPSRGDFDTSDVNIEKEKEHLQDGAQDWPQILAALFIKQAINMKSLSRETYELYSRKAALILIEMAGEAKQYLATTAVNPPEPVKDIVEFFSSPTIYDHFNEYSKLPHFCVGIPYGALLSAGGFVGFMLTGSISAIRFGIILGGALLALSISSLRSWKKREPTALALKGLTAIATILFLRELRIFITLPTLANSFTTIISGGVAAFYLYQIIGEGQSMTMTSSNIK